MQRRRGRRRHDVVADCLAVPGCRSPTTWGFTDKYTWLDEFAPGGHPLPFDETYAPKPAYDGVRDALMGN